MRLIVNLIIFILFILGAIELLAQNKFPEEYKNAPYFISRSPENLANFLTKNDSSDYQKV
ncbi:hypothetical protein HNQ88_004549 [Aureibacter tunicatorum]|uniref:Uncharacterized protein n=1 Tax=Aureibacter tunicatorum TaxID=866807 RepID=A0AAE3XRU5_9BACT|nr:hypothetical protein [Aureibacter tunicatorum]BDD06694.1 hypothetical protein AUTU_41770 [Aureibacter tunicatorum]